MDKFDLAQVVEEKNSEDILQELEDQGNNTGDIKAGMDSMVAQTDQVESLLTALGNDTDSIVSALNDINTAVGTKADALSIDPTAENKSFMSYIKGIISTIINGLFRITIDTVKASTSLTRPANTTDYTSGDLICGADVSITATVTDTSFVLSGISAADIAKCKLGMHVVSTGIAADSYITAIGTNTVTIDNIAHTACNATHEAATITCTPVLLTFDLSSNTNFINGGKFEIDEVEVSDSSLACATAGTQMNLILFDSIPFPTSAADNAALNLAATELAKRTTGFGTIVNPQNYGSTSLVKQVDMSRQANAQATSKLVFALAQAIKYTPTANGNVLTPCIKGKRLN